MTDDFIPVKELMRKNNLTMGVVKNRMNRGWTFEDAVSIPPLKMTRDDTDGKSLRCLAKENGINHATLCRRIYKKGMSVEDAINCGPRMTRRYGFDTKQAAEDIGIARCTLYRNLRNGLTLDEIAEKFKRRA